MVHIHALLKVSASTCVCRADNQRLLDNLTQQRRRADRADAEIGPLRNELRGLRASAEAHSEEMRVVRAISTSSDPLVIV